MASLLKSASLVLFPVLLMVQSSNSLNCYECTQFEEIDTREHAPFLSNLTIGRGISLPTDRCPDLLTTSHIKTCAADEQCVTMDYVHATDRTLRTSRFCAPKSMSCSLGNDPNYDTRCQFCNTDRCNGDPRLRCYSCQDLGLGRGSKSLICPSDELTENELSICHTGEVCIELKFGGYMMSRLCGDADYCLTNLIDSDFCSACAENGCNNHKMEKEPIKCYSCLEKAANVSTNATDFGGKTMPSVPTNFCPDVLTDDQAVTCAQDEVCITLDLGSRGMNGTARMCGPENFCSAINANEVDCDTCDDDLCNAANTMSLTATIFLTIPAFLWKFV